MLRKRDRLLLTLAAVGDFLEEVRDPFGLISLPFEEVYGFTPPSYKRHNFRKSLVRSLRVGNIEKIEKNNEIYLRLTGDGRDKVMRDFPLISFCNKKWDKKWRMLIFDIEERKRRDRNILRNKLYSLGFGKLQKSVYISPFAIENELKEFLEGFGFSDMALVFTTQSGSIEQARKIAGSVWNLGKINDKYRELFEKVKGEKNKDAQWIRGIKSELIDLLLLDPFLPSELLPENWIREKVVREIKKMKV